MKQRELVDIAVKNSAHHFFRLLLPPSLEGGLRGLQINDLTPLNPSLKKGEAKSKVISGWVQSSKTFILFVLFVFLSGYSLTALSVSSDSLFPKPDEIEKDVLFWKRVYTEISTAEGFIHDSVDLSIVYETISVSKKMSRKARSRSIKKIKKKYQKILKTLAQGKRKSLTTEEKRILALWPDKVSNKELSKASKRLRFQLGQSDKFEAGLIRSGRWKSYILKNLKKMGLPEEIAALPHVESSFNYKAYSKVGAAGMWQFTRSTGRRYMRVDHVLDERRDPFIASVAAARLLKNNFAVTGTWPMAITAYNHGAAGMRRAAKQVGSKDIDKILRNYKSRSFGFASRNFYPSFLAAVEIDRNPEKYFKNVQLNPPGNFEFIKLSTYISTDTVLEVLDIERTDLMAMNPALRPAVWNGNKYIPKNYELRIDKESPAYVNSAADLIANIDSAQQFEQQKRDRYHRVTKGQTLSVIAARYRIKVRELVSVNNMRNKNRIRVGQVLILPDDAYKTVASKKVIHKKVKEQRPAKIDPAALPKDGIYIVQQGDSIDRIARNNTISVSKLLKLNRLKNKNKIYPGQKLLLTKPEEIPEKKPLVVAQLDKESPTQKELKLLFPEAFDTGEVQEKVAQIPSTQRLQIENGKELNGMAESIGDKVLEESEGDLLADPSDYSVTDQNTIEIQAAETLGHYAEWLKIRASDLRRLNGMKYGKPVVVGKRLKLSFKKVTVQEFEAQRLAYHKTLQAEFFEQNQIVGEVKYRLHRGQSVWRLTHKTYKIPFWLLRQYNPDLNMNRITPEEIITFPKVKQRDVQQT